MARLPSSALDTATPLAAFGTEQIIHELAGERNPLELEPALKAQIVERGLEWAQRLPSELDQMACLERLAPLTPAYLTSPQVALQTLQRELQRRRRSQRRARSTQATPAPETPTPSARPAIPKAIFQAESEVLRATLYPESAAVVLPHLPSPSGRCRSTRTWRRRFSPCPSRPITTRTPPRCSSKSPTTRFRTY